MFHKVVLSLNVFEKCLLSVERNYRVPYHILLEPENVHKCTCVVWPVFKTASIRLLPCQLAGVCISAVHYADG